MKLVIYFESFPTSENPYLGNYAIDIINDFLAKGFNLEIVIILPLKKCEISKVNIKNSTNYKIHIYFYRSSFFRFIVPFQIYSFIITLFKSFNKKKILVNSTLLSAFAVHVLSKINRRIKLYTIEHNSKITSGEINYFYKIISKIIVKQKNHLLLSFFQKNIFENWINYKLNSNIISLPSSFSNHTLDSSLYTYDKDFITILCVAPLNVRKGIIDVLDAFTYLHINGVKCKLIIIGQGELYDFILNEYSYFIENKFLVIKNYLNRDCLLLEFSKTHFVISLSKFETFGLTIVEALLMGKFVISTKVGICTNGYSFEDLTIIDSNSDVNKQILDIIVSNKDILSFERSLLNSINNLNVYCQNQLAAKIS